MRSLFIEGPPQLPNLHNFQIYGQVLIVDWLEFPALLGVAFQFLVPPTMLV